MLCQHSTDRIGVSKSVRENIATLGSILDSQLRIWQVPACKMEPQRGIIFLTPTTHPPATRSPSFSYRSNDY